MKHFSKIFILLGVLAFFTTGCNEEGCTDPNATNYEAEATKDDGSCEYPAQASTLMFHLHPTWGMDDLNLNSTVTTDDGRSLQFTKVKFYFSNVKLTNGSGDQAIADSENQFKVGQMMYTIGEVDPGSFTGVSFNVGLDSALNFTDPSTFPDDSPLSSSNPDYEYWSWASGYKFIVLEGVVDTSAAMSGTMDSPFEFHIGGNSMLRTATVNQAFEVLEGQNYTFNMMVNVKNFFNGIDLRTDNRTHTMDNMPLAAGVADNVVNSINPM